ncbi:MAG: UbiX family flavin prenyltransferase [Deltaproteobacteria bacterium]|nr:UbiX family flavin prenyltransferase [Deltaproteobacteria bacterium]
MPQDNQPQDNQPQNARPVVVGLSGASGAVYGVELVRALGRLGVPAHLIISPSGRRTIELETGRDPREVEALAARAYDPSDVAAAPASGSFLTRGMVVAPCSMRSLSAIAMSQADNLLTRAADVHLKERRLLVLMVRETPLHKGHLELMLRAADLGAVILPPLPAFYHQPRSIADLVAQSVGKALDQLGLEHDLFPRWSGAAS